MNTTSRIGAYTEVTKAGEPGLMARCRPAAIILFFCAGLLGACSSAVGSEGPAASGSGWAAVDPSANSSELGSDVPVPPLEWGSCDEPALGDGECAILSVPRTYDAPDGPTIDLFVYRVKAQGVASAGVLVVNPGGPASSGVDFVASRPGFFPPGFDVVTFDPRGTGRSEAIDCLEPEDLDRIWGGKRLASDEEERQQLIGEARRLAERCSATDLGPYVGTTNVARDIDRLRAALGEEQISYLGFSYGTVLGWTYAALFPHRVRAMALDGPVDPRATLSQTTLAQATALETVFTHFARWCTDDPAATCPDDPTGAVAAILTRSEEEPLPTSVGRWPLTSPYALNGIITALYVRELWPDLGTAMQAALDGDGLPLAEQSFAWLARHDLDQSITTDAQDLIWCADHTDRPTPSDLTAQAGAVDAAAPTFAPWLQPVVPRCHGYAPPTNPVPPPVASPVPILVIAATGDVATPYTGAQTLTADLGPTAMLLTRDGDGHTSYGFSRCIDAAAERYLRYLKFPDPGTVCPE